MGSMASPDPSASTRAGSEDADLQRQFWNAWNARFREEGMQLPPPNARQAQTVLGWLRGTDRGPRDIVEVGCGSGWLCGLMTEFGKVQGIDLADEVLARSRARFREATFTAGDFMRMELPPAGAHVVVALEVLSHVSDQPAFISRVAQLLRGDGVLMLATQNRFVLERTAGVTPKAPGQVRQWVDAAELRRLLEPQFEILQLTSLHPTGHLGVLRWVNSGRLESLLSSIGLANAWTSLREKWLLGHTLMVHARKRVSQFGGKVP